VIEGVGSGTHAVTLKDSKMQAETVVQLREYMKEQLSKKPEIAEQLTPAYAAGCRRMIPGPGYLQALVQDNVTFYSDEMESVNATGVKLKNGKQIDLDIIIYATGFNTAGIPSFEVTGKEGLTLEKKFSPRAQSYLSIAIDDFPNYFMMLGGYSTIFP
jgi:cation diffusion facilitator CzcD-associated flavoprotein CzcO